MFTGLIRNLGTVQQFERGEAGAQMSLHHDLPRMPECGASIAVDGVCVTVVMLDEKARCFTVDLSPETLSVTNLGALLPGCTVHVEPSLRLGDELGGHMVSGHVDGTGQVTRCTAIGDGHYALVIDAGADLAAQLVAKGWLAVNGVSLTINHIAGSQIEINLIPETMRRTLFTRLKPGDLVNLELDPVMRAAYRAVRILCNNACVMHGNLSNSTSQES